MPNHYPPYPSFHGELMAAIGLMFIVFGLMAGVRRSKLDSVGPSMIHPIPRPVYGWGLMALIPLLQYFTGQLAFRSDAAFGLAYGLGAAISIWSGWQWAQMAGQDAVLRYLFSTIVLGATIANFIGLAQWLKLPAIGWWIMEMIGDRPFGNLAQSNHFGLLMVLGVIGVVALYELNVIRNKWLFSFLATVMSWGVLMSQSRAAALAFILTVIFWFLTKDRAPTRLRVAPVLFFLAVWLIFLMQFNHIQEVLVGADQHSRNRFDGGVRPAMWNHFITAIQAHPWRGYGFNQGVSAMAEVATDLPTSATRATVYAHNFFLDLAVWSGLPVAIVSSGALVYWISGWIFGHIDPAERIGRHLVFAVWLVLITQSLLEYPYAYAYFLLPSCLLAGAITGNTKEKPQRKNSWVPNTIINLFFSIAFGLVSVIVWDYFQLEEDFRHARFARANYVDRPHHDYHDQPLLLDCLAIMHRTALRQLTPQMTDKELNEMRSVARRVQNVGVQTDYAKALALNGRIADAQNEISILKRLYGPDTYAAIEGEWKIWLNDNIKRIRN